MRNILSTVIYIIIFLALFLILGLTIKLTLFPEPTPTLEYRNSEYSVYCLNYAQDICRYLKDPFYHEDEAGEEYKECVDRLIRDCLENGTPSSLQLASNKKDHLTEVAFSS